MEPEPEPEVGAEGPVPVPEEDLNRGIERETVDTAPFLNTALT